MSDKVYLLKSIDKVVESTINSTGFSWMSNPIKKGVHNYISKYMKYLDFFTDDKDNIDIDLIEESIKSYFIHKGGSLEFMGYNIGSDIATALKEEFLSMKSSSQNALS